MLNSKTENEIKTALQEWLSKKNGKISPSEISVDTPLLENKILKSLHLMELVMWIENCSGKSLDVESFQPGAFKSINHIYDHFFKNLKATGVQT